jgi:ABC-2 type transport system ATP-binding protein
MYAIDIDHVTKGYGPLPVLQDLTLHVQPGEVYGLLGPNGAGKTTLLHLLLGFLKPNQGSIRVLGESHVERIRGHIGYLPEQAFYHRRFSAQTYLAFLAIMGDVPLGQLRQRINQALAYVRLSHRAKTRLSSYTRGMLQQFGIAQALLVQPNVLLLDEPTSGIEPSFRYDMIDIIAKLHKQESLTMLICTHHLDVIESLCDRVGILSHGRLAAEVDVEQIRGIGKSVNIHVSELPGEMQITLNNLSDAVYCNDYVITLRPNTYALQTEVIRLLLEAQIPILSLESLERPIEHLYLDAVRSAAQGLSPGAPQDASTQSQHRLFPNTTEYPVPDHNDPLLKELLHQEQQESQDSSQQTDNVHPEDTR